MAMEQPTMVTINRWSFYTSGLYRFPCLILHNMHYSISVGRVVPREL